MSTPVKLTEEELEKLSTIIIPTGSGVPSGSFRAGYITYDTASNFLYIFNGTSWRSSSFS